jgi:hypothetical protein
MSSENTCEKQVHRKSKVSWGRLIHPGLVGPKPRSNGVGDGQSVNIRIPAKWRYQFIYDAGGLWYAQFWMSAFFPPEGGEGILRKRWSSYLIPLCQENYMNESFS